MPSIIRRGVSVWELAAACFLLGVLAVVCLQFFRGAMVQRDAAYERLAAVQEAENLLERYCARDWDALTPEGAHDATVSAQAAKTLSDAKAEVWIDAASGDPAGKRLSVVIHWQSRDGSPRVPVRLVTWKYRI